MRNRVRSEVEIAESSSKLADIHSAIVVGPTAFIFGSVDAQFAVFFGQLTGTAPFCARQDKILPERPPRPVS